MGAVPVFGLADRLVKARRFAELEQRELAARVGISSATARNYEHGATRPRWLELSAWARVTGVDLEWLASGKTGSPGGAEALAETWRSRKKLLQLDSNQQPAGYRPARTEHARAGVVTDLASKRAIAGRRATARRADLQRIDTRREAA